MANTTTWNSIEENFSAGSGENHRDPISPMEGIANSREELDEEDPVDRVESIGKIDFKQNAWALPNGEGSSCTQDVSEIVLDLTTFYKRTLIR